jgi:RNA polymerase sigma factor (sigma-70 family)
VNWRSLFVRRSASVSDSAPAGQLVVVEPVPPSDASPPSAPRATDERLESRAAFRRFVARVTLCADRWLALAVVPPADRDDVLQETLCQAYKRRETYDPKVATWEDWAFGYASRCARTYHRAKGRRLKRVDVAPGALPDIAVDDPNPEERLEAVMLDRLRERCLADLDPDSRAILFARADGRPWAAIADAFGVSVATARRYYDSAREELQEALDREQGKKRALGVAVLPPSIDQLIASDSTTGHVTGDTMGRIWKTLDRAMDADVRAGKLRDDGPEVERYMGSADARPRPSLGARALRALGPRGLAALTHLGAAVLAAGLTYAFMRPDPSQKSMDAEARAAASSAVAQAGEPRGFAPTEAAAPSTAGSSSPIEEAPSAGAPERSDAGSGPSPARPDIAAEQGVFDLGTTAYQAGHFADAIKHFAEHARKHPRGQYAATRDRLWTLALIRTDRKTEARQRIEQLRRADPESKTVKELDAALSTQ